MIAVLLLMLLITLLLFGRPTARFFDGETVVLVFFVTCYGLPLLFR